MAGEFLDCPLGGFKIFEVTIDIKSGLNMDLSLLTGGLGGLGTGTRGLRSRASGLRRLECGLGLSSNRWGAACNLKVQQQLNKISNPLQNGKTTTQHRRQLQSVETDCRCRKISKKFWFVKVFW
jgi:hypothetical protein